MHRCRTASGQLGDARGAPVRAAGLATGVLPAHEADGEASFFIPWESKGQEDEEGVVEVFAEDVAQGGVGCFLQALHGVERNAHGFGGFGIVLALQVEEDEFTGTRGKGVYRVVELADGLLAGHGFEEIVVFLLVFAQVVEVVLVCLLVLAMVPIEIAGSGVEEGFAILDGSDFLALLVDFQERVLRQIGSQFLVSRVAREERIHGRVEFLVEFLKVLI